MLHIVNKSPFERSALISCLRHTTVGDTVLLIEDAVVAAVQYSEIATTLLHTQQQNHLKVYALQADLKARGIPEDRIITGITLTDYTGFVRLTIDNPRIQSWL